MKFARELEQDLVPEWRAKYLDYKAGKKKVKAVTRVLAKLNQTPKTPRAQWTPGRRSAAKPSFSPTQREQLQSWTPKGGLSPEARRNNPAIRDTRQKQGSSYTEERLSNGRQLSGNTAVDNLNSSSSHDSEDPLLNVGPAGSKSNRSNTNYHSRNYGSISPDPLSQSAAVGPPSLELPGPAMSATTSLRSGPNLESHPSIRRTASAAGDAYEVGRTHTPSKLALKLLPKHRQFFKNRRTFSTPDTGSHFTPPFMKRLFTSPGGRQPGDADVPLEAYKEFDLKQAEFFTFLDKELNKIETFYKAKEAEAGERLKVLKQQLHEMRDRRLEEVLEAQQKLQAAKQHEDTHGRTISTIDGALDRSLGPVRNWIKPIEHAVGIGPARFGRNTEALQKMGFSADRKVDLPPDHEHESWRDFTRKPMQHNVPYRVAKRKLKVALQEYYRGLELLKSYALLNRTAFRKINKKYDKAVQARPTGRFVSEKVNTAYFVQSEVLDQYIVAVEDNYARYFEKGNHKVAVGKLRKRNAHPGHFAGSIFRNGFFLAAGGVLAIEGAVYAREHLSSTNAVTALNASYLLQIYGGYFLALTLFLLFCVDCKVWAQSRINYIFIFEFDTRHNLDWHQLAELPCLFFFLFGLSIWLNFQQTGADTMYLYWPVLLIGISVAIVFLPFPLLYHRSRFWFVFSNFRLLLAGIYPVEFRDFFLGDMFCSLTYAMGNLPLFFCVYAQGWSDPTQCNSTHSRVLGFFSTLPGIWRLMQCLRRYYDTRNVFPHLVNGGKYLCTILFYMSLSLYRIDETPQLKAVFIFFATVNAIYVSIWDIAMDWSLGNPYAKHPFLRDVLGYKNPYVYYFAMLIDPVIRFNWIFYAIFASELQHSAILSFLVGLTEICRRAMWTLFRVENEHCTNVGKYRASRDVPLPYAVVNPENLYPEQQDQPGKNKKKPTTSTELENQTSHGSADSAQVFASSNDHSRPGTIRRRITEAAMGDSPIARGINRVGTLITEAHAHDFERKKKHVTGGNEESEDDMDIRRRDEISSDESEGGQTELENQDEVERVQSFLDRHKSATENEER